MSRTCARSSWSSATRSTWMPSSSRLNPDNEMPQITLGSKVPQFTLPMTGGGTWSLKDAAGQKLVIYFYPKDMTSGCTRESQDFRDLHGAFRKAGVQLVGVSR